MTETQVAVILERLDHINARIDCLEEGNSRIEAQALLTNGRVTTLEKWKSYVLGAIAMATFFLGVIVPLLVGILFKYF